MMLQQTPVERVITKYEEFICTLPDFQSLAVAPLRRVLELWQGLGYNRRALYLQQGAQRIVQDFGGALPSNPEILETLPGIGHATAREIAAFAFRLPVVFIETNIRRVFIHFFFGDSENINDREILPLVEETLDRNDPRTWYYALMDYGVMLRRSVPNPNLRSAHYQRQAAFHGSNRQLRGAILRVLTGEQGLPIEEISGRTGSLPAKVAANLEKMVQEGFLREEKGKYYIK
jgi:A/G-specific adenine glycosylase